MPYDPAISLLYIPKINEKKIYPHKNLYLILLGALFLIAPKWKQPKCPPIDEWIQKTCYIFIMELLSSSEKE